MIGSDSPTNLAWQINQNSPTSRVDAMEQAKSDPAKRGPSDYADVTILPELLDRTY
jgi:hypothetical protein